MDFVDGDAALARADHPATTCSLLTSLFRGDASLHLGEMEGLLTVRPLHQQTRASNLALAPFLDELNLTRTVFPARSCVWCTRRYLTTSPAQPPASPAPRSPPSR